jgi:tetratricopeptide (TPR) repeat protein
MSTASLTPQQQELLKRAREASDRSTHDYAITLLRQIVTEVPSHLEARRLLRANELLKFKTVSSFSKSVLSVKIAPLGIKGRSALKKAPAEAMEIAEEMLLLDPTSEQGNNLLAEAALAADMVEVALLAYETLRDAKPTDVENLKNLGHTYLKAKQSLKAQNTFEAALRIKPNDGDALKGMKDSSAAHASESGSWEEGGDYRKSLKSADEAKLLEQASKVVKSEEAINEQLALLYQEYEANNQNISVVLKIADLCERKNDFESAIAYFEWAYSLTNKADSEIEKRIHRIRIKTIEDRIQTQRASINSASAEDKQTQETALETLLLEKAGFELDSAKERVARYPNDLQLRFELGQALVNAGQLKEAVPELQQALRQPNVRYQAYNLLGIAFQKRGMLDFAVKQFQTAKSEMPIMDNLKKEVIYNLGLVLEDSAKKEEALEQFKEIYEVDSQYRDVAHRVESSYGN